MGIGGMVTKARCCGVGLGPSLASALRFCANRRLRRCTGAPVITSHVDVVRPLQSQGRVPQIVLEREYDVLVVSDG